MDSKNPIAHLNEVLDTLYFKHGYDFRGYSKAHIYRRLSTYFSLKNLTEFNGLKEKVSHEPGFASKIIQHLSITVTEMFRDPAFFRSVKENLLPLLRTYSYFKIWHAGCSTGEEVYSLAILLSEAGLYDRATIYATDFNQSAIDAAREGIFPADKMKLYTQNYQRAGGHLSFSEYYTSKYNHVIMDGKLKKNIVWSNHNLVTDGVFSEMHLILCRNVLIYFEKPLQNRVHRIFYDSLVNGGLLCLGSKESLRFTDFAEMYSDVDKKNRIFRKKYRNAVS